MSAAARRVLVACVGNPDRGDDGVGAAVAAGLAGRLPPGADLVSCSGDLLALVDGCAGYDALVCVDAAAPAGSPGAVQRLDLASGALPPEAACTSSHGLGLAAAIGLARALQAAPRDIVVFAVEGRRFDGGAALSAAVAAAVAGVTELVAAEAVRLCGGSMEVAADA
ncbi:MAG: hydrogenase maturation protease [Nevskia sp.]|nr:hydrogenase maturation protease [Nevskia sp.]